MHLSLLSSRASSLSVECVCRADGGPHFGRQTDKASVRPSAHRRLQSSTLYQLLHLTSSK
uniref:Uncharacterized protein n=1 Tax=Nelumbo nucifera TaxID=4432 RepID=A0A822ZBF8_NELNU|nr:TPA_asm: hypothetical protein HUJ06_016206 [Nelumbo nucifera]